MRKRVNTLKRVSAVKGNYKAKKNIVSQHGKGLLKLIPTIVSALDLIGAEIAVIEYSNLGLMIYSEDKVWCPHNKHSAAL